MHHCESSFAVGCVAGFAGRVDGSVRRAAYGHVRVPDPNVAGFGAGQVHLHDDSTGGNVGDCKAHILDLRNTNVTGVADLDDGLWIVGVTEGGADAGYYRPGFSDNASSGRDKECGFDNVYAIREVSDLAVGSVGG